MKIGLLFLLASTSSAFKFQQKLATKNGRIIGGKPATVGQYPFAAAIYVTTADGRFFCSGSLIGAEWILTVAQCISEAASITIYLGSNLLESEDPNRLTLATSEHFVHPDYNLLTLENNIGLIKLRIPVIYTDYIKNVYLARLGLNDFDQVIGLGWGHTSDAQSTLSNELRYANFVVVSNEECKLTYADQITDDMVCVAGDYNEGTCTGDSGGALLHFDYMSKALRLVGLSSFNSANGCESLDPSGYTRTYNFRNWITNITNIAL